MNCFRLVLGLLLVLGLSSCLDSPGAPPDNSLLVLKPYWHDGTWVFDDARTNLRAEPFVAGIPEMISHLVKDLPAARQGFRLSFSAGEFPGYQLKLDWRRTGNGGNWYYSEALKKEGWLCPSLLKYFKTPPRQIFVKADPLTE